MPWMVLKYKPTCDSFFNLFIYFFICVYQATKELGLLSCFSLLAQASFMNISWIRLQSLHISKNKQIYETVCLRTELLDLFINDHRCFEHVHVIFIYDLICI